MNCKICGKEIAKPKRSYCGKICAKQGNLNNALVSYHGPVRTPPISKNCIFCNAPFDTYRNKKICGSQECSVALRRRQNKSHVKKYMQEDYALYIVKQREYKRRYKNRVANNAA